MRAKCPGCGETEKLLHGGDFINNVIKCRCLICHPASNLDNMPAEMLGPVKSKIDIYWPVVYWNDPGLTEWHPQKAAKKILIGNTFIDPLEAARKREADRLEQHHD